MVRAVTNVFFSSRILRVLAKDILVHRQTTLTVFQSLRIILNTAKRIANMIQGRCLVSLIVETVRVERTQFFRPGQHIKMSVERFLPVTFNAIGEAETFQSYNETKRHLLLGERFILHALRN